MSTDTIKKKTKRKLYSARKEVSLTCRRLGAALPFLRRTHAVHWRHKSSPTKTTSVHLHILQIKHETNEVHSYEMRGGKEGMPCPLCNQKMVGCYWETIWCCRGLRRGFQSHSRAFLDFFQIKKYLFSTVHRRRHLDAFEYYNSESVATYSFARQGRNGMCRRASCVAVPTSSCSLFVDSFILP